MIKDRLLLLTGLFVAIILLIHVVVRYSQGWHIGGWLDITMIRSM